MIEVTQRELHDVKLAAHVTFPKHEICSWLEMHVHSMAPTNIRRHCLRVLLGTVQLEWGECDKRHHKLGRASRPVQIRSLPSAVPDKGACPCAS